MPPNRYFIDGKVWRETDSAPISGKFGAYREVEHKGRRQWCSEETLAHGLIVLDEVL
ncbi:hypothetical protein [Sphingomonas sp. TREG-RG-20F-R18-01]|uniref:hypothetical protein n=1 Tax=Sphingomonas sp. TREG-RG-20F-R18-01 TaxID=2914982 RepID=UPI001F575333|nr:hypothetical protein [Sphingomonas sp. TREG-RG-20F-R18-01]